MGEELLLYDAMESSSGARIIRTTGVESSSWCLLFGIYDFTIGVNANASACRVDSQTGEKKSNAQQCSSAESRNCH